jgi:hypothetical protein
VGISEQKLLTLLQKVLGSGKIVSKDEAMFRCPFSNHRKPKLAVNLSTQRWQSWIDTNSKGRSIYSLFKKLNVPHEYITELSAIVKLPKSHNTEQIQEKQYISLPYEFISLKNASNKFNAKKAISYLHKRNIFDYDIIRYNIGYCEEGDYTGRIIVPSYDKNNQLNYFVARDFSNTSYLKYKNPPVSKDVIVFENQLDFQEPIILCEGVFDAIAIRRNAIPLLGKNIPSSLKIEITKNKVSEVVIVLDNDAFSHALKLTEELLNQGIKVKLIKMGTHDAADIGFVKINNLIKNTQYADFQSLMYQKLCTK